MCRVWSIIVSILFLIFSSLTEELNAFNSNWTIEKDSLERVIIDKSLDDSLIMDAHLQLGRIYRFENPNRSLDHLKTGLNMAEQCGFPIVVARALADIGLMYWRLSNFNLAYDFFFEAGVVFLEEGDRAGYARILNSIGTIFARQGFQDKALENFLEALQIYEELDSVFSSASVLNNIGMVYLEQNDYVLSEQYHQQSLKIKEAYDDQLGKAFSLNNLGTIRKRTGNYDEALNYFNQSLEIRRQAGRKLEIANTKINIGYLFFLKRDYEKAIKLLEKTLAYYEIADHRAGMAEADRLMGMVYAAVGDFRKSHYYYELSLITAEQLEMASLVSDNYKSLSDLFAMQGNYAVAYDYQNKHLILQDSINDAEATRRIIELRFLYEREQRENEIQLLRKAHHIIELNYDKQRLFRNFLILFIILIFVTLLVIYFRFLEYKRTNFLLKMQKEEIANTNKKLKELNLNLFEHKEKVDNLNKKLQESERNLININNTKDKLFSIISHDLRNPFASIVSFSRILKRDIDTLTKEEVKQLAEDLDHSVIRINNLLDNLLQWSRTQTGNIGFRPEYFDLKEIVAENIELFSSTAREKDIEIIDQISGKAEVYADMNMTDTVLRNLISNALKYTHPGGKVEISASMETESVFISVADTGIGISEKDKKKLFRSDMLHSTYGTRDEKGSGLGLLICRDFVKRQGGDLTIKSEQGKGSIFSFSLPRRSK